jgi:hypothetical protein
VGNAQFLFGRRFFIDVLGHIFEYVRFIARKMANFLGNKNVKVDVIVVFLQTSSAHPTSVNGISWQK